MTNISCLLHITKGLMLAWITLVLLACAQQATVVPLTAPDFSDLAPFKLAINNVKIENKHNDRLQPPYVEGLSQYPPAVMIEQWVNQTMSPTSSQGLSTDNQSDAQLLIKIQDASIIEEKLPPAPGLSGLFSVDQTEAYHGHITLALEASFSDFSGEIVIESRASQTVDENASLRDREEAWIGLANKMIRDIDRQLRQNLPEKLPRLLLVQ